MKKKPKTHLNKRPAPKQHKLYRNNSLQYRAEPGPLRYEQKHLQPKYRQ